MVVKNKNNSDEIDSFISKETDDFKTQIKTITKLKINIINTNMDKTNSNLFSDIWELLSSFSFSTQTVGSFSFSSTSIS